ncbi:hypothetical protein HX870_32035 [Pseudomonas gingeri]|uniref:hypothetical protein n=1 Tax=Pseudomonas gingeri TaxID=117681 RepID=UPI0015A339C8|nr:hypothetical protein [Pseudomonas gingeri]NWA29131.1 hypothetical protein [Pseudomonas gingeri]NWD72243.1 hypothetical protein [Pseudomonas gingeri]
MTTPTHSGIRAPLPASTQLALRLQSADLTQMLGLLQEVAWQPLSAQARLFLQPESLFGLHQLLCHVLPSRRMRPQGAVPMAFVLHTLRRALLHESDPRRRVELAHDCVDALLLKTGGVWIGKRIARLHGLEAMDIATQGFIELIQTCAAILRDPVFIMARLGIGGGWFGAETGVAARLGKAGTYGSGGHINRARFAILRSALVRGDEIKRPPPSAEPVLDATWLRKESQLDLYRLERGADTRASFGGLRLFVE